MSGSDPFPRQHVRTSTRQHIIVYIIILLTATACISASVESYVKQADKLIEQNKTDDAIILYQKAIQEHPAESVLYLNQASLFRKEKKYPNAVRNYSAVLKLNPDSFWPYIGLGRVYLLQNKPEEAKRILLEGQDRLSGSGPILFWLGRTSYQLGDGNQAIDYLNQALDAKYPKMYDIYFYRGLTFEKLLGDKQRAKLDFDSYMLIPEAPNKDEVRKQLESLDVTRYNF